MRNCLQGCGAPFSGYVITLRVAGISIGLCSSKQLKALGLSQARPEPSLHLGLEPSLRFFEAQALNSQAKPGLNITIHCTCVIPYPNHISKIIYIHFTQLQP
jgi:hypothetical protein